MWNGINYIESMDGALGKEKEKKIGSIKKYSVFP